MLPSHALEAEDQRARRRQAPKHPHKASACPPLPGRSSPCKTVALTAAGATGSSAMPGREVWAAMTDAAISEDFHRRSIAATPAVVVSATP